MVSKNRNKLLSQFEWRLFEFESLAWRVGQQKAKVYVQYMSLLVQHDVLVVAVLDLEYIAHQTVGGETVHKVFLRFLVVLCVLASEFRFKVINECAM